MGHFAFAALPAWQQQVWAGLEKAISRYCLAPDDYFTDKPRYAKYCVMPNGQVIPHGPTDRQYAMLPFVRSSDPEPHRYVLRYYIEALTNAIASGSSEDAAIFAGVIGHFLQDSAQPAHLVHNDWLFRLVRRPAGKHLHLHREMDGADPDPAELARVQPQLLGTSFDEAAFQLRIRYESMVEQAYALIAPMVQAIWDDDKPALDRAITPSYTIATQLTASVWYTAHCLAAKRFDPAEVDRLRALSLSDVPFDYAITLDPYAFRPLANEAADGNGGTMPLSLRGHDGTIQTFARGIAMTWGNVEYELPPGLYKRLRARIGVHTREPAEHKAVFKIVLNGSGVVYAAGLKDVVTWGGPVVFDSGPMCSADAGRDIDLPLGNASRLTWITECSGENVSALWCDPVLAKL